MKPSAGVKYYSSSREGRQSTKSVRSSTVTLTFQASFTLFNQCKASEHQMSHQYRKLTLTYFYNAVQMQHRAKNPKKTQNKGRKKPENKLHMTHPIRIWHLKSFPALLCFTGTRPVCMIKQKDWTTDSPPSPSHCAMLKGFIKAQGWRYSITGNFPCLSLGKKTITLLETEGEKSVRAFR